MKSICFFSSYYNDANIPNYVKFYLSELKRHFSEVTFLTNEKSLSSDDMQFLHSQDILYKLYKNEGFDFGMWYKAFQEYDITGYDRIGLVNDSCILFNKLDPFFQWIENNEIDYCGMTDCSLGKYHIQSYFVIINKKAIAPIVEYFKENGIVLDYKKLIKTYEIGVCTYLMDAGINIAAYYSFKITQGIGDPCWTQAKTFIRAGYPLIKKKILIRNYGLADPRGLIANGFDPYPNHYIRLIKETVTNINMEDLISGLPIRKTFKEEVMFYSMAIFCQTYSVFKKMRHLIKITILGAPEKNYIIVGGNTHTEEVKKK